MFMKHLIDSPIIRRLKKELREKAPDWLYCLVENPYRILLPGYPKAVFFPRSKKCWLVLSKGLKLYWPIFTKSARHSLGVGIGLKEYEHYFKVLPDDVVLDVGACFGNTTLLFAKKARKVIAIEPEPLNVACLQLNVFINKLRNVCIVKKAAWNCKTRLKLNISEYAGWHSIVLKESVIGFIEVEADTLDNIVSELGVEKVNFIKINIEGAEIEALEGGVKNLRHSR